MHVPRVGIFVLLIVCGALALACRTAELVTGPAAPPSRTPIAQSRATRTPQRAQPRPSMTSAALAPTNVPPPPTEEPPTQIPAPVPTRAIVPSPIRPPAVPTRNPAPTAQPSPSGPTPTVGPTHCPQKYCVVYRGCQAESGNTIVEGIVYNGSVPENGVTVRVAKSQGAYPIVEMVSGTDPINPGKPDPNNPGRYFLQIQAGRAEEGNWWVFAVDVPNGTRQISEAKLIHTNDDATNPGNCQHAFVDFVR